MTATACGFSHWNIGDGAIWQGEAELLRRVHGKAPVMSRICAMPSKVGRSLPEAALIYLHGGGNFGDIWPTTAGYAKRSPALPPPPHRALPQSLHYRDQADIGDPARHRWAPRLPDGARSKQL